MKTIGRARTTLRWPLSALIAALACNACSAPAPPAQQGAAPLAVTEDSPAPIATTETAPTQTAPTETNAPAATAPQTQTPEPEPAPSIPTTDTTARDPPKPVAPVTSKPIKRPAPLPPPPSPAQQTVDDAQPSTIAIYSLSRGKGVPPETREALKQIRALLEQKQAANSVSALQSNRIGIEGETRLCAEFRTSQDAQAALAEIRRISAGMELLNVVEEPCPSRKEVTP